MSTNPCFTTIYEFILEQIPYPQNTGTSLKYTDVFFWLTTM